MLQGDEQAAVSGVVILLLNQVYDARAEIQPCKLGALLQMANKCAMRCGSV